MGDGMPLRATLVTLAIVATAGVAGATPADAATWRATVLPMPAGHADLLVQLNGTDGKGQYSGTAYAEDGSTPTSLIIWTGGKPKLVAPPAGCHAAAAVGESSARVIAVAASCATNRTYTYSGGRYRALTLPPGHAREQSQPIAINKRGDVLGQLFLDSASPSRTVVWRAPSATPFLVS
jgi:hypothetical protein